MTEHMPKITMKAARVNAGLNQEDAAKKLGVSLSTLQNYENGKTLPDIVTVQKMEDVYQFPSNRIFFKQNHGLTV